MDGDTARVGTREAPWHRRWLVLLAAAAACHPRPRDFSGRCPLGRVDIPRGSFWMGSPDGHGEQDEHPAHWVTVGAFCMDRTEVTVGAYGQCVAADGCSAPAPVDGESCNWEVAGRENHPINCVDWGMAATYCRWAGGRLPTEAEWEYAARGTDGRAYPWGNDAPGGQLCWRQSHSTCVVGSHPRGDSPFGLHDMAGNVWEWTSEWYGPYSEHGVPGSGLNHVDRGGSWLVVDPSWVRASCRDGGGPSFRDGNLGFRCAYGAT